VRNLAKIAVPYWRLFLLAGHWAQISGTFSVHRMFKAPTRQTRGSTLCRLRTSLLAAATEYQCEEHLSSQSALDNPKLSIALYAKHHMEV